MERKHELTPRPQEMELIAQAALWHPRAIKVTYVAFDGVRKALGDIYIAHYRLSEGELLGLQELIDERLTEGKLEHALFGEQ